MKPVPLRVEISFESPITNTTLPTIMSAGKDEKYGVDYLLNPTGTDERDNIYSFKVK